MPCEGALPVPAPRGSPGGSGGGQLRRRVHQHLGGRAPVGPYAERAQRKPRFGRERGHAVQAPARGCKGHMHGGASLCGHIGPGPVVRFATAAMHGQADAIARRLAFAGHLHFYGRAGSHEVRLGRLEVQRDAAQRGVADVHADHGAARQQKGQQVAQVELVVDGGHQQDQQRQRQHPPCARGQDVDIALGQRERVAQRPSHHPPVLETLAHGRERVERRESGAQPPRRRGRCRG